MVRTKYRGKEGVLVVFIGLTNADLVALKKDKYSLTPLDQPPVDLNIRGDIRIVYAPTTRDFETASDIMTGLDQQKTMLQVKRWGADRFYVNVGLSESQIYDLRHEGMIFADAREMPIDGELRFSIMIAFGETDDDIAIGLKQLLPSSYRFEDKRTNLIQTR